ncbi:FecR family protein [Sphingobacterium sp. SG20118]|uniref:FecR family protein n=1 Tax=Sphingobacterium sp. SG20118 TaxID=3367156 RepID=UPI0037DFC3BD
MIPLNEQHFLLLTNKLLAGTITPEERIVLKGYEQEDENKKLLLEFLESEAADPVVDEVRYERSRPQDLDSEQKSKTITFARTKWIRVISIAASIILLCLAYAHYWGGAAPDSHWETIRTGRAERKSIKLRDGSEVWLNNESELRVKQGFGKTNRILVLKGEAYFSIAKNERIPLVVKTNDADIQVLGTKFNLRAIPEEKLTTTSLFEGKVKLILAEESYDMLPGDKVAVKSKGNVVSGSMQRKLNVAPQLGAEQVAFDKIDLQLTEPMETLWMKSKLAFNGDDFDRVAQKMQSWFNQPIVVVPGRLSQQHITGVFQETTCEQVLELIKRTGVELEYYMKNDTLYVN